MQEFEIIRRLRKGEKIRAISREMNIDRKTIRRYRDKHEQGLKDLKSAENSKALEEATEQLVLQKEYNSSNRKKRTFTPVVEKRMRELLNEEIEKDLKLGRHKQSLTAKAVCDILQSEGHAIKYRTVAHYWSQLKKKEKEAFIKQEYRLGSRVEFDFGEVKLEIDGQVNTYYLAVWASPASNFYWAYLYTNQKQLVFLEAHVRFFEKLGGVYEEVVYDNMKHVVTRFIGHNEKELNKKLIQLALYYGFDVNVTNCFSGNEKGTVESRVKVIRRECFSKVYQFSSLEEAREHLEESLMMLNQQSKIEEEKTHLLDYRPPFELAELRQLTINKYATVHYQRNQYSVPDYLVGHQVQAKIYAEHLVIFAQGKEVARHKKIEGSNGFKLDIHHYIKTFERKPNSIKHSLVLKQNPQLESLYYHYYSDKPKEFIAKLKDCIDSSPEKMYQHLFDHRHSQHPEELSQSEFADGVISKTEDTLRQLNVIYGLEVNR